MVYAAFQSWGWGSMNDVTLSEVGMCVLQLANLVICEILEKVAVLSIAAGFLANRGVMDTL